MPILRNIIGYAVKRAASDPEMRAKALDYYQQKVRPSAESGVRRAREDLHDLSEELDPRESPARFAGRFVGRWRGRLSGDDEA